MTPSVPSQFIQNETVLAVPDAVLSWGMLRAIWPPPKRWAVSPSVVRAPVTPRVKWLPGDRYPWFVPVWSAATSPLPSSKLQSDTSPATAPNCASMSAMTSSADSEAW